MVFQQGSDDPAASMSLLRRIEEHSLDPAYRSAAEEKRTTPKKRSPWVSGVVLVAAVGLGWGATAAASSLRVSAADPVTRDSGLVAEVQDARNTVAALEDTTADLRAQVIASEVLEGGAVAIPEGVALLAANTRVQGPGVIITLEDGASAAGTGAVTDQQLRAVQNLLWAAGAEAMAIDGNRIGPATSIRTAGSSILVNLQPVTSPYVVEAIGEPAALLEAIQGDSGAQRIGEIERATGSPVSAVRSEKLTLSALALPTTWTVEVAQSGGEYG